MSSISEPGGPRWRPSSCWLGQIWPFQWYWLQKWLILLCKSLIWHTDFEPTFGFVIESYAMQKFMRSWTFKPLRATAQLSCSKRCMRAAVLLIGANYVLQRAHINAIWLLTWRIQNIKPEIPSAAFTDLYRWSRSCHVREGKNGKTEKPRLPLPKITFPF